VPAPTCACPPPSWSYCPCWPACSEASLVQLAQSCNEFLVHGVDVEGMQLGIDDELVGLLGDWSPIPVTYAGGARTLVSGGGACQGAKLYGAPKCCGVIHLRGPR
jgi:imidazole glycerol phosphate synthase subunit HisF